MLNGREVIGTEWTLLMISYALFACRIWVRLYWKQWHLFVSDIWLLIAALSALGVVICDTFQYQAGAMSDFNTVSVALGKIRFAENYFFDFGMYFPKFSILALYFQLIPNTSQKMRMMLYVITVITIACAAVTFFADTFWCGLTISTNWSTDASACATFTSMKLVRINWSMNFITEFLIFTIPIPLLCSLHLPDRRQMVGLLLIFSLGLLTLAVSTARFISMLILTNNILIYILATSEITTAIIIVSLTALRPLIHKVAKCTSSNPSSSAYGRPTETISSHIQPKSLRSLSKVMEWRKGERLADFEADGATGSETELDHVENGNIYKTERFGISNPIFNESEGFEARIGERPEVSWLDAKSS